MIYEDANMLNESQDGTTSTRRYEKRTSYA